MDFELPQPVAFDGEPGKNEETGHYQTKANDETGKGTWISRSVSR